jgi:fatty-acyl-CoA synthase
MGIGYDNDMIVNLPLPLFHVFAGGGAVYSLPVCPTTVVLPSYRYSAKAVVTAFNKYKCKELLAVPTMAIDILNYCQKKEIKIPTFHQFVVGAAPVPEELAIELKNYFPSINNITVGYGCTEAGPASTLSHTSVDQSIKNSTCGTPLDFVHVRIADIKTNQTVKHGEVGEVVVTGNVMKEYWKAPEKTKEVVENGWYRTGDLGTLDSKGFLRIVGRTKELIIRGGANIYPREVEEVIMLHDNVLMAAVCGLPHPRLGEEVCAWVQLKDPKAGTSIKDIQDFCKDRIANYKIPVYVLFVNSFPMTASGKVQKFAMTEQSPELIRQQEK